MNAIEIRGLTKVYPKFTLESLDLDLPQGCIMGLIGENGAGKSTAIRLMLGNLRRNGGTVKLLGQDIDRAGPALLEDVGVVPDVTGLPDCLTAAEVGKVMSGIFRRWEPETYAGLLKTLDVPTGTRYKALSKGNRAKVRLAVAMSHGAKLLILDEATNGLDPVVRDQVMELIENFTRREDCSVLMSSHIVSDLEKVCDYVAFLHKGKLMLVEEKDVLLSEYGLLRCSAGEMDALDRGAVLHRKDTPYGAEALVRRDGVPEGMSLSPVNIEELFIHMVKEVQ